MHHPPRVPVALLMVLLPSVLRDEVVGDLAEEYADRSEARGRAAASAWYWREAAAIAGRAFVDRFRRAVAGGGHRSRFDVGRSMGSLAHDLSYAGRRLRRRPGFTALAIATLALGIGAQAALFSVVDGVLWRRLDLPDAGRVIVLGVQDDQEVRNLSGPDFADLREGTGDVFSAFAGFARSNAVIEAPDGTREVITGVAATPGIFAALSVPFQLGGPWGLEDEGPRRVPVVVLTDRFWRGRLGGDSAVLERPLVLDGHPVRVSGVLPPGVQFPTLESADLIHPLPARPAALQRDRGAFLALARLREGVTRERARAALAGRWEELRAAHPAASQDHGITAMGLHAFLVKDVRPGLFALMWITGLLLLLACANAVNLVLAGDVGRAPEMALRTALGAGGARLVRQLLVESVVLVAFAACAGVCIGYGAIELVHMLAPQDFPPMVEVRYGWRAVGVALLVSLGCALLVGLLPALRTSGRAAVLMGAGSRGTPRRRTRGLHSFLVVAQVAAAVALAVAAGLLLRSFARLSGVDPGYRADGVVTASLAVPGNVYDGEVRAAFFERAQAEISTLPGILAAGTTLRPPFSTGSFAVPLRLADRPSLARGEAPRAEISVVSSGYFDALRIPLVRGRSFAPEDRPGGARAAVISAQLAQALFGDANPLGRRLMPVLGDWDTPPNWAQIVGVVGDIRLQSLEADMHGTLYLSATQHPQPFGTMVIRVQGEPSDAIARIRETLLNLESRPPAPAVRALPDVRAESLARPRFQSLLVTAFAMLALTLAIVGIYGLLSCSVAARRTELAVRVAVGADRRRILRLVLAEGMTLVAAGLVLGMGAGLVASRALGGLLVGVVATDPATYIATAVVVTGIALASCFVPALRASHVAAAAVLRGE